MSKTWRRKAITAKIEPVYATDAEPTGAADALVVTDFTITPIQGQEVSRNLELPHLGGQEVITVAEHVECSFKVEIAGAGPDAAGPDTPPAWGPLMRGAGHAETIDADTSVTYTPISAGFEALTIYANLDGTNHALLGSRATVSIAVTANQLPYFEFRVLGLLGPIGNLALPVLDTSAFADPLAVSNANTAFTLNAVALPMRSFNLAAGQNLVNRQLVNSESIKISARDSTGTIVVEVPDSVATFNPFALQTARTRIPAVLTHGTVAKNIVTVTAPTMQITRGISYTQQDDVTEYSLPVKALPTDAGNDEYSIVCT